MNGLFKERNRSIVERFDRLYQKMPTMRVYAQIGVEYGLSEERVRKIVYGRRNWS